MKFLRKTAFFTLLTFYFLMVANEVLGAPNYWMAKESLVNDLRVRTDPTVKSKIIYEAPKFKALKHISNSGNWYKVETPNGEGYASKSSVVPFDEDLWFIADKVFKGMWVHKVGTVLYISAAEICFIVDTAEFENIPEGKDNAITVKQYINNRGGLDGLTPEQRKNCNFL